MVQIDLSGPCPLLQNTNGELEGTVAWIWGHDENGESKVIPLTLPEKYFESAKAVLRDLVKNHGCEKRETEESPFSIE